MTQAELRAAGFSDDEITRYQPIPSFDVTGPDAENVRKLIAAGFSEREIAERIVPKPPIQNPPKPQSVSYPEQFRLGLQKGVSDVGLGAVQRVLDIVGAGPTAQNQVRGDIVDIRTQTPQTPTATAGQFGGQMLATGPLPGGATGGLLKRLGGSILAGAGVGALQPTESGGETAKNIALGGGLGATGSLVTSGIAKVYNSLKDKLPANELQVLANKWGIRTTLGEVTKNANVQKVETLLEGVPIIGLRKYRQAQQAEAEQAAKSFFGEYVFNPSLGTTAAMKESNDLMLNSLYESMKASAKKLPSVVPEKVKTTTAGLTEQYPDVFEAIQDSHVKRILKNIAADTKDTVIDTGVLNTKGVPVTRKEPVLTDFNDLWLLRKGLGKEIGDARTDTARMVYKELRDAVSTDMETMFAKGGTETGQEFKAANEAFKRYSLKFDALREAYDKAVGTTKAGEMFSPKKFSTDLKNLANDPKYKRNIRWSDEEVEQMTGLANILQVTKRAGQYAENPPTGNRWGLPILGAGMGSYALSGTPGGVAIAGGVISATALTRFLVGTEAGKKLSLVASRFEPTNPLMQQIVEVAMNQAAKMPAIGLGVGGSE